MRAEEGRKLQRGDIVQISHQDDRGFRGCFMVIHEILGWGAQGWVPVAGAGSNPALYGLPWSHIEPTGGRAIYHPGTGEKINEPAGGQRHHP